MSQRRQTETPAPPQLGVELAVRHGDGLEVTLLWDRSSGRVWVDVLHVFTGESFQVEAHPARALDVYYHPFAFCPGGRESQRPRPSLESELSPL